MTSILINTGSLNGYRLIKRFEGCKLFAYQCSAGIWTIGYGHTVGVKKGDKITMEQADKFFETDIKLFEMALNKAISGLSPITQNQYDALLSLAYNAGIGATSEIIEYLREKGKIDKLINVEETVKYNQYKFHKAEGISNIFYVMFLFCKWISSSGKPSKGLYDRRFEESLLFLNM